jgi:hypothetical protein
MVRHTKCRGEYLHSFLSVFYIFSTRFECNFQVNCSMTASEITALYRDQSAVLLKMIERNYGGASSTPISSVVLTSSPPISSVVLTSSTPIWSVVLTSSTPISSVVLTSSHSFRV